MDVIRVKDARELEYIGEIDTWYDFPSPDYVKPKVVDKIRDNIIGDVELSELFDPGLYISANRLECELGQVR